MKKVIVFIAVLIPVITDAQLYFGVKAGLNFVNVTSTAGINAGSRSGYMIGAFLSAKKKNKIVGLRSEMLLSRQGYDYKTGANTGNVNLDYLLLPQLITFNFGKKFEVHIGGQMAFLLNAQTDSASNNNSLFDYFNRFDYGAAGGFQVFPYKGLFIGARINLSLHNLNKETLIGSPIPAYIPKEFIRNNVLQLYAGWRFKFSKL